MKKMMIKNTIRNSIYIIKNRENLLIKDYQYQNKGAVKSPIEKLDLS